MLLATIASGKDWVFRCVPRSPSVYQLTVHCAVPGLENGNPFVAIHIRRGDFLNIRRSNVVPWGFIVPFTVHVIETHFSLSSVKHVYVATDSRMPSGKGIVFFRNCWYGSARCAQKSTSCANCLASLGFLSTLWHSGGTTARIYIAVSAPAQSASSWKRLLETESMVPHCLGPRRIRCRMSCWL